MNCLIVDDEPFARKLLTEYVGKVPSLTLIDSCADPMDAMRVIQLENIDLLFLDIQMPGITGIALLKSLVHKPMVILTTAYSEYALESYDLDVVDYLLKPITLERFLRAVDRALARKKAPPSPEKKDTSFVFVKDGTKMVKINWDDILYIEGLKDYVTIHTRTHKVVTLQRLKTLEEQLPADRFIRIHHSYIISKDSIDVVHKNDVQIGNAVLPISDSYKKTFRQFLDDNHIQ